VDYVSDPNGPPPSVLDADEGFEIGGRVTLPNWLNGKGHVTIYAHELGGPLNKEVGKEDFDISATNDEPKLKTYPWTVSVGGKVFPDPQPNASQVYQLDAVFTYGEQSTDIATFVDMGPYMIN